MARKIETEKVKKKKRKKGFLIFLIILLALAGLGYGGYRYIKNKLNPKPVEIKEIDKVETKGYDYGYSLTEIDSKYYQEEFKKLKEILTQETVDDEAYATQLAKCFVIDLYTLSTKINKYDVGGREFYYSDKQDEFGQAVMNSIYDKLIDNTYGDRKQDLPEVTEVKVNSTEKTKYVMGTESKDGYLVKMNVSYKGVKADTAVSVVLVKEKDGKKISVVDTQNTLSPNYNTK
jgi:hypothetical protein